jgi:triacylglycerol lipase
MRRLLGVVAAVLAVGMLTAGTAAAGTTTDPWPSPPGANNWSCRPTAAHPRPVVLVHGLSADQFVNWAVLAPQLAAKGYCVYSITYGRLPGAPFPVNLVGGLVPMEQSSKELAAFVDRVLGATGAAKVDIVGHSEGSLMPDYYLKFLGGAAKVDHYVGLTPLWQGSKLLGLDELNAIAVKLGLDPALRATLDRLCGSCREFLHGSAFLTHLNRGGAAVPGVTYTMLMTRDDELVQPYTSGVLPGRNVTNIVVQDQCRFDISEHLAMAVDPIAAADVFNALDPAHARPVHC